MPTITCFAAMASKMYVDYATTFKGHFKQGRVVHIDTEAKEVIMESGEKEPYHVLIIATGCQGPFPAKMWDANKENAVKAYNEYVETVRYIDKPFFLSARYSAAI